MTRPYKILFGIGLIYSVVLSYFVYSNRMIIISNKQAIDDVKPLVDSNTQRSKENQRWKDSINFYLKKRNGN